MKIALTALVALFALLAGAQQRHPAPDSLADVMQYGSVLVSIPKPLRPLLKLTKPQDAKLAAINAKYDAKVKAAPQNKTALSISCWSALYAVLTPAQKTTLKGWVDSHHHHPRPPG